MAEAIRKDKSSRIALFVFLCLSTWWILLQLNGNKDNDQSQLFAAIYGIMALLGAIWGIKISSSWGGFRSLMGRSILFFSFGLFAQEFGQLSYSYYAVYKHLEVPYPSIGDIGYFISIPFYVYGVILLAQASGVTFSLKSIERKIQAVIIPIAMLVFSYLIFLQGYQFDWSKPLTIFLDFGYPFGEATYISFALLAFLLSRNLLGGVMKLRVLFILMALLMQYLADFAFLYQATHGTFIAGGVCDFMYLISYFGMTLALLELNVQSVKNSLDT